MNTDFNRQVANVQGLRERAGNSYSFKEHDTSECFRSTASNGQFYIAGRILNVIDFELTVKNVRLPTRRLQIQRQSFFSAFKSNQSITPFGQLSTTGQPGLREIGADKLCVCAAKRQCDNVIAAMKEKMRIIWNFRFVGLVILSNFKKIKRSAYLMRHASGIRPSCWPVKEMYAL